MKIKYNKVYNALLHNEKLPRKIKKHLIGKKLSKVKLDQLLKSVEFIKDAKTMYDIPVIKPYLFCPKCGCTEMWGTGNITQYPEHYEHFFCYRCRNLVAVIDNSPFIHVLETEEYEL